MNEKVAGALFGAAIGFVFAWAWLSDPAVIRDMLLLREADVYLLMGSAIAVAFVGSRLLRRFQFRALANHFLRRLQGFLRLFDLAFQFAGA